MEYFSIRKEFRDERIFRELMSDINIALQTAINNYENNTGYFKRIKEKIILKLEKIALFQTNL